MYVNNANTFLDNSHSSYNIFRKNLYFFYEIIKIYSIVLMYLFCFCVRAHFIRTYTI
nr:MAG TPA: hypothetical protein [Microviridae sp.]